MVSGDSILSLATQMELPERMAGLGRKPKLKPRHYPPAARIAPGAPNLNFAKKRAKPTIQRAEAAIEALGSKSSFLLVYYGSDGGGGWQSLDDPLRTVTTLDRFTLVEKINGKHQMRMLQPNELARAMGLPNDHKFNHGTRRDKVKLCGNGICAPVMRTVVSSLIPARFRNKNRRKG